MKKGIIGLVIAVIMGIIAIIGYKIYDNVQEKKRESNNVTDLVEYYNIPEGEAMVIFDEKIYDKNAIVENGNPYLDLDTVRERYDLRFFWSKDENLLYYTTPSTAFVFTPGQNNALSNRQIFDTSVPVVIMKGDMPYILCTFLNQYTDITYSFYTEPCRLLISYENTDFMSYTVETETAIRVNHDIKSDILEKLPVGSHVRIIDGGGIQENGFIKVMSDDGVRGYIRTDRLSESAYESPKFKNFVAEEYVPQLCNERVYLAWQLLYTKDSTDSLKKALSDNEDLTVVAPTWYFLNDTEGNFSSYANQDYVKYAHSQGVDVWATIKNDDIDGQFSCSDDSFKLLSSYDARQKLIDNIINHCTEDGVDGINVDFEMLSVATGVHFIQFLRELSIECRKIGLILSVDNYVPENFNAYYDLPSQADIVDYVVIMGYDEHYAGSDEAGSVSSLSWFTRAADNTLAKVPAERIIMGVPFYTRLWKEVGEGENLKLYVDATPLMKDTEKIVKNSGAEKIWKDDAGQNYIEYKKDGAVYKMWIEDMDSLKEKALVIRERNLGGIAAWKLGDETEGTWEMLWEALDGKLPEPENTEESAPVSDIYVNPDGSLG